VSTENLLAAATRKPPFQTTMWVRTARPKSAFEEIECGGRNGSVGANVSVFFHQPFDTSSSLFASIMQYHIERHVPVHLSLSVKKSKCTQKHLGLFFCLHTPVQLRLEQKKATLHYLQMDYHAPLFNN
jgi:hypothetical protein